MNINESFMFGQWQNELGRSNPNSDNYESPYEREEDVEDEEFDQEEKQ